jgi:hypothetical protein
MTKVLITIDTEIGELGENYENPFELLIEGKLNGQKVGYKLIIKMLKKYNAIGEFFVDIYPFQKLGEQKFKKLCQNIVASGHKVNLHTHPSKMFDPNRKFMHEYSLKEQTEILKNGKNKIKEWTGIYPLAHRAGGYGINKNTFKALNQVGIKFDSSYFYKNSNCKYRSSNINNVFKINQITEIPVTTYEQKNQYYIIGIKNFQKTNYQKLDFRYGSNVVEIQKVISQMQKNSTAVIFLHSFNFLNLNYDTKNQKYLKPTINNKLIKDFKNLLKWIKNQKDCEFSTINKLKIDNMQNKNELLTVINKISMKKKVQEIYKTKSSKITRI